MDKQCKVCNKPLSTDDPRKQYCSNACKQEAHRQRHGIDKPIFLEKASNKLSKSIKRIEVVQPKPVPMIDRVEADNRFVTIFQAVVEINSRAYKLQLQKDALLAKIAPLENSRSQVGDIAEGLAGGIKMGKEAADALGDKAFRILGAAIGVLSGFQQMQSTDHDAVNRKNKIRVRSLRGELREIDEQINSLTANKIYLENGLNQLKRDIKAELTTSPTVASRELPGVVSVATITPPVLKRNEARIISIKELKAQEFDMYQFSDGFDEIIGNPSKNFSMNVYGESGQGKSTWVIEFANYLAEKHGRVLYNSSEERISQSLKRKLLKYDSDNFAISECQTYRALKQAITGNGFNFVVVDSINDMNIKANEIEQLREMNADKAFIFIMQATKQGNYKGNSQFVHDADILIKLENYQPIVEKTRFK
jgi:nucleoside-triphosphatase THEP1